MTKPKEACCKSKVYRVIYPDFDDESMKEYSHIEVCAKCERVIRKVKRKTEKDVKLRTYRNYPKIMEE